MDCLVVDVCHDDTILLSVLLLSKKVDVSG